METLELLRLVLARDVASPPALEGWDAAAWESVHRAIVAWDAAPLVYAAVRAARLGRHVPPLLLAEWRKDHVQTTAVNLRLSFEVDALGVAFAREGARAAPLKGTALFLLGVYRDPGARPTNDVDLVIEPDDGAVVDRVLCARGFERTRVGGSKHWPPYLRDGLMVEVHEHAFWSMADGHRVRLREMLAADERPALGATVAHLLHHLFESSVTTPWLIVKTLADLAEVRAFCGVHPRDPGLRAHPSVAGTTKVAPLDRSPASPSRGDRSPPPSPRDAPSGAPSAAPHGASRDAASGASRDPHGASSAAFSGAFPPSDLALEVAASARRFGLGRRLGALAGLLARVLEQPVPAAWMRETRGADVDALLRRCGPQSRLLDEALRLPDRAAAFARMPLSEKTALLRYHLLPPADAMRALYDLPPGSPWVWPLYPLRPAHLLARSALDAARLVFRRRG